MASEQRTRGGARPGTGPKPKPDAMVTRAFVIRQDQVDLIARYQAQHGGSFSSALRAILDTFDEMTGEK